MKNIYYIADKDTIMSEFIPWLEEQSYKPDKITEYSTFPKTIMELEDRVGKLVPNFTKEDVEEYLSTRRSRTPVAIRRFYTRCKIWIKYCNSKKYYNEVLNEDELFDTFLYTVPLNSFVNKYDSINFIFSEIELKQKLEQYIQYTGNYMVASSIVLSWFGIDAITISKLLRNDVHENGDIYYEGKLLLHIDDMFFYDILINAKIIKSVTLQDGRIFTLNDGIYFIRSKISDKPNESVDHRIFNQNYIKNFNRTLGTNFRMNDIRKSGTMWRLHQRELSGRSPYYLDDGTQTHYDVVMTYEAYKKAKESCGGNNDKC